MDTCKTQDLDWIENDRLRIGVSRAGAELVSLQARDNKGQWQGFLYRDSEISPPSEGWGNHATVMGYFLHRLLGERSEYKGKVIRGGNHGFIRHLSFPAPEASANRLVYSVSPEDIPREAYPLRVSLELSYTISEGTLEVGFLFSNQEEETAHLSFGLHPGFAVKSPLTCSIHFPPGRYIRHRAPGNFLDGNKDIIDFEGGEMPFPREKLPDSYLLELGGVPEPLFTLRDSGRTIDLDFRGVPYMTVWSDLGHFLCLEPCWGLPDSNPQKPFEEKVGIQTLQPNGRLHASFRITPSLPK